MATYYIGGIETSSDDLFHYGVKGMKWGKYRRKSLKENPKERLKEIQQERETEKNKALNDYENNKKTINKKIKRDYNKIKQREYKRVNKQYKNNIKYNSFSKKDIDKYKEKAEYDKQRISENISKMELESQKKATLSFMEKYINKNAKIERKYAKKEKKVKRIINRNNKKTLKEANKYISEKRTIYDIIFKR